MPTDDLRQSIARKFVRASELEQRGASPLYERLSLGIAQDPALLTIAAEGRRDQPLPNLFFAAVHMLLLRGVRHELANFYPSVTDMPAIAEDPFPHFRSFCLEHAEQIKRTIAERRVQTNVVERCGLLLPAFGIVAERVNYKPLHLVEIGCSAGLNLLWDKYSFNYGTDRSYGDCSSVVQISVELRGEAAPPLPDKIPPIAARVGIDLNPIDVWDDDATQWLRALVWPEDDARLRRLNAAMSIAQAAPPTLMKGDALELLPGVLADASGDAALIVYHTHTVNQFSAEARQRLDEILSQEGSRRDLYWISSEYRASPRQWLTDDTESARPTLRLVSYEGGIRLERTLARCHHHGRWMEWLGD